MIDVYSWPTPNGHKVHIMLEEIGLLDETMRFICSDVDYSFTARARGWKVWLSAKARGLHKPGASIADAALSMCPVMLLVLLSGTRGKWPPKTRSSALVSWMSPSGVLVAWALM